MSIYLTEQIRTTQDLIDSEPTAIVLQRRAPRERTKAGGLNPAEPAEPLDEQTFFFAQVSPDAQLRIEWQGEMVVVRWVIVGMPNADLKEGDEFTVAGRDFRIMDVHPDRRYEVRGWVIDKS